MLAVLCAAGLILLHADPSWFTGLRSSSAGEAGGALPGGAGRRPGRTATTSSSTSAPAPGTSAPAEGSGSGRPVIVSISPANAAAGQQVTISGSGFHSANGIIVAYFGLSKASTRCPSYDRCVATAPAGLSGTVDVRVRTDAGVSNSASFSYRAR